MDLAESFLSKVLRRTKLKAINISRRFVDAKECTYSLENKSGKLDCHLLRLSKRRLTPLSEAFESAINNFLSHNFDLLGSGWVQFTYGQKPIGIENISYPNNIEIDADHHGNWLKGRINSSNLTESMRIWQLIDFPYTPIDWQLDVKSGYRWKEIIWSADIKLIGPLGSDIKVPWELARMQHLPQLAIYYFANLQEGSRINIKLIPTEFRNQILDFIATNPPRYGANWVCTMDVAIRVANWLIAYDLLISSGVKFDTSFEQIFSRSVYEHGRHIVNHLEWVLLARGNHYLANIIGLVFVSCYLPNNPEINIWLAFSIQEYIKEVSRQFHSDGSNFEASTSYHRLSTQMIIYGAALLSSLSSGKQNSLSKYNTNLWTYNPALTSDSIKFFKFRNYKHLTPLPDWIYDRIELATNFTSNITKPNGLIPLIGDNDSGYLFKISPRYNLLKNSEWQNKYKSIFSNKYSNNKHFVVDEEQRDHQHLIAETAGLFGQSINESTHNESLITAVLAGHNDCRKIYSPILSNNKSSEFNSDFKWTDFDLMINSKKWVYESHDIKFHIDIDINNISLHSYQGIGIYLFKTKELFMLVRCGEVGQEGVGGHAHNDQLSLELNILGEDIIVDPGTYVYTAFPNLRNSYRSATSHFAPQFVGEEPSILDKGLFVLKDAKPGICLYFGKKGFIGMHEGFSLPVYRRIEVRTDRIIINDISKSRKLKPISYYPPLISPRYGMQLRSKLKS